VLKSFSEVIWYAPVTLTLLLQDLPHHEPTGT